MLSTKTLLFIGVVFHVVYLRSIFDIYFTSPIVHGMTPHSSPIAPPADRLVLIVGDGLRADKFFELNEQNKTRAPFLRNVIEKKGAWGVSHTRVPTESRPGHVAIIAGFYEDVSAVTTGWTTNPVNFDSVFNQSQHTWSFGSPDILPMFQQGASDPESVETFMYPPEYEDFSGEASRLDTWVFDNVKQLFKNASTNPELNARLRQKKVVFFLHLLGLDTNGHGFRPTSKEYLDNINLVDSGVKEMVELIEKFYRHDGRTSYVFTADHGMNNRGAHGDGHPDNTRTPIVAWGAGVRNPVYSGKGHDDFSANWGLSKTERNDIEQADIAPLMSHLIGINYPVNNVGSLPLGFLRPNGMMNAEAAFTNALQILEQLQVKHNEKAESELFFRPFPGLTGNRDPTLLVAEIKSLIADKSYELAEQKSKELMSLCLQGMHYFQTYDWFFLRTVITVGYVGWCAFCIEYVFRHFVFFSHGGASSSIRLRIFIDSLSILVMVGVSTTIYIQKMPFTYHAYTFFPVFFWNQVLRNYRTLVEMLRLFVQKGLLKTLITVAVVITLLETLVNYKKKTKTDTVSLC
ncbi:alkaline-phosphatase-like protein [Sporodiniella umbellata]|nr:alkaline-phosphatase-like protein [Sporodiniella umbellata]